MAEKRYQFVAEALGAGAVSKDGYHAVIEFTAGGELMWITVPLELLKPLARMATDLESLGYDARNGLTPVWHIAAPKDQAASVGGLIIFTLRRSLKRQRQHIATRRPLDNELGELGRVAGALAVLSHPIALGEPHKRRGRRRRNMNAKGAAQSISEILTRVAQRVFDVDAYLVNGARRG